MQETFGFHGTLAPGLLVVLSVLAAAILIFELIMLVHVIRNLFIPASRKAAWIVGMFLLHPFVAIWYFCSDYRKRK